MDEHPEDIRQRGLDDAGETLHMLRQRQEEREQRLHAPQGSAGEPEWAMPAPEPPKPVHRAPEPRERRAPAPPLPTKVAHTSHDSSGRITEVQTFEGTAAASARGWEQWIRAAISAQSDVIYDATGAAVAEILKEERAETNKAIAELEARIEELERLAGSRRPREELDVAAD